MCVQGDLKCLGLLCRDRGLVLSVLWCPDECEVGSCGCNQKGDENGYKRDKRVVTGMDALWGYLQCTLNAAMRVRCIQGHYSVPQSRCDPRLCDASTDLYSFDFVDVTSK